MSLAGFQPGPMWQLRCWVKVRQRDDDTDRTNELRLRGLGPRCKPRPFTGRAGAVWGWNGHTAEHNCWTKQEDGLIKGTKVACNWGELDMIQVISGWLGLCLPPKSIGGFIVVLVLTNYTLINYILVVLWLVLISFNINSTIFIKWQCCCCNPTVNQGIWDRQRHPGL